MSRTRRSQLSRRFSKQHKRSRLRRRHRRFEPLEDRLLLAVFTPSKDNTLYESQTGAASNGAGIHLYAGLTNQTSDPLRRALLAFDLTSIPAGSTITAATLDLVVTRNPRESLTQHDFALHRLMSDWGEGTSAVDPTLAGGLGTGSATGDATWLHTSFDTANWTTPGGDFAPTASATTSVGNDGATASWSSAGLVADVQAWVDAPGTNFGWMIRGDESTVKSARRFSSKEGATPPTLDVTFTPAANSPTVTSLVPAAGSHAAPPSTSVAATFSQDISSASATTDSFVVHAAQTGPRAGAATITSSGTTVTLDPISDFHPGELVQATATSAIRGSAGQGATPHVWQFRTGPTAGSGVFNDSGQTIGIAANNTRSFALAIGDLDGDGDIDMFVANDAQGSRVYLNDGAAVFTDTGQSLGSTPSRDVALGDLDGDGDLDAVVANTNGAANRVWQNDGSGVFSETQNFGSNNSTDVKLADLDADGDLDAFIANAGANRVWLNNGGVLSDSGQNLGNHTSLGVALGDVDGDGDLDAFVGNTFGHPDRVWTNDGNGAFSDSGQALGNLAAKSSRDVVMGDVDGDGDLDAFVVGRGYNNRLFLNGGEGVFTDSGQVIDAPVNPFFEYGAAIGDVDADGDLDIVTAAAAIAHWNRVFLNDGDGGFTETGQNLGGGAPYATNAMGSYGIELGDLDGDGDLDVAISNDNTTPVINSTSRVWLNQNLTPSATLSVDTQAIAEAAATATVTVTLSAPHTDPVTVDLGVSGTATATDDYTISSTQIVIAAGATTGAVTISAVQDALDEPDETVIIDITGVTNAQEAGTQQVTVTIQDDDEPIPVPDVTLVVDNAAIPEAGGVAVFTAHLSVATTVPVTIDLGTSGTAAAADFNASATQITVAAGGTSGSITVTAVQDAEDEPDETVVVDITGVTGGNELGEQQQTTTILDDDVASFVVTSLTPTDSGFEVEFNGQLNRSAINLYDTQNANLGAADVVVTGAVSGAIEGSLIVGDSSVTFIKSGEALPADTYTITLRSGADAFNAGDAMLLDGDGDGTGGDDYVSNFTVAAAPAGARTVSIPDFVRGPGQDVNLPADGTTGIPITISEGENVRAADIRISYDPDLLEITNASSPTGGTVVLNNATPGLAILVYFATAALPAGASTLINLEANVPGVNGSANYRRQQVLDVHGVTVGDGNDNEFPVVVDDATHFVTYFADVSGNGRINAADAAQDARFAALLDTGFAASLTTDPTLIGDISGNGRINAADASLAAQFAALLPVPEIPAIPSGIVITGLFGPREAADSETHRPIAASSDGGLGFREYIDTMEIVAEHMRVVADQSSSQVTWLDELLTEDLLLESLVTELARSLTLR